MSGEGEMGWTGEPWLVRVEDRRSVVRGAGTLLDERFVLTCAHVVDGVGSEAIVRVQGRSARAYLAKVVGRVDPDVDRPLGDVAVLELAEPVDDAPRARLRRKWSRGDAVHCFGFSSGAEQVGVHAEATIAHYDMDGERVQLDAGPRVRITEGFSGAAALTAAGDICGVIVSVDQPAHDMSWMIDITAILNHIGPLTRPYLVVDAPSGDRQFTDPTSQPAGVALDAVHLALEQALVDWLASDDAGGVAVVCGAAAMAVVSRLVGLTVRAYRARVAEAERDRALPVGSIDAAVDAEGRTADEVVTAISDALGLRCDGAYALISALDALGPSVTIVVNSVDAAVDPAELCERVLRPIAVTAPLLRVRLLLGFAGEPPGDLADAVVMRP
jgi:hypothetical protein